MVEPAWLEQDSNLQPGEVARGIYGRNLIAIKGHILSGYPGKVYQEAEYPVTITARIKGMSTEDHSIQLAFRVLSARPIEVNGQFLIYKYKNS